MATAAVGTPCSHDGNRSVHPRASAESSARDDGSTAGVQRLTGHAASLVGGELLVLLAHGDSLAKDGHGRHRPAM